MVSRLQFLLNENRVALSSPFAVGANDLHTDAHKPPEALQLDKLRTQLLGMRRICSEKEGARLSASHSVTISGKLVREMSSLLPVLTSKVRTTVEKYRPPIKMI